MKLVWFSLLFCSILFPGFGETIYVYTHEICNEEPVPYESQVKEGLLEGLFNAGHIVFDDIDDSIHPSLLNTEHIQQLITNARKSGANFLVGASIMSHIQQEATPGVIESTAFYYMYDVFSGEIVKQGNTTVNNAGNKQQSKESFWFQLGIFISEEINRVYQEKE